MADWRRHAILILCAMTAWLLSMFEPLAPFYQPLIAVILFVVLTRFFKVASFIATLVFALLLACAPVVIFSVVAATSPQIDFFETFYWSIISISERPAVVAFFLFPIVIALATYVGRRWLYP